mgnify:CR=1 FL=1
MTIACVVIPLEVVGETLEPIRELIPRSRVTVTQPPMVAVIEPE